MSDDVEKPYTGLKHGAPIYKDWLTTLDEDQLAQHKEERRQRKVDKKLKKLVNERLERDAVKLADAIIAYAVSMIENNVDNPVVFNSIMDKFVGKDVEKIDITNENIALPSINIVKKDT